MGSGETRGGAPERIGKLLEQMFAEYGIAPEKQMSGLAMAWRQVIGPHIAAHTRVESFRGGTLTVALDSAPARQEVEWVGHDEILSALRERLQADGGVFVRELRFRVV